MNTIALLDYMELLRYDRKLTQSEYLEGVVSQRQYYRYRSGESEIPFSVLAKLSDKLQIPLRQLMKEANVDKNELSKNIVLFFNFVLNKNMEKALQIDKLIHSTRYMDDQEKILYKMGKTMMQFYQGSISKHQTIDILNDLIKYPSVLKKEILSDNEFYVLGLLSNINELARKAILDKLYSYIDKNEFAYLPHRFINLQLFFWTIKNFGILGEFDKVIILSSRAIEYSNNERSNYLLETFYYFKALAHYRLKQFDDFKTNLIMSIICLEFSGKDRKKLLYELFKKDFNIDVKEFMKSMIMNGTLFEKD